MFQEGYVQERARTVGHIEGGMGGPEDTVSSRMWTTKTNKLMKGAQIHVRRQIGSGTDVEYHIPSWGQIRAVVDLNGFTC